MNREEIKNHLEELSDSEINYLQHPENILNQFYLTLDKMGLKDEHGVYYMPEDLIVSMKREGTPQNISFWQRLDISPYQDDFVLKKATRFYREPFMYADFIAIRYIYRGQCNLYLPNKMIVLEENDTIFMDCGFIFSQELPHQNDIVFTFLFPRQYISEKLQRNSLPSDSLNKFFFNYIHYHRSQSYEIYHGKDNHLIRDAMEAILCEFIDPISYGNSLLMESLLNIFLIQISTCESESQFSHKEDYSRIAGMLNYINIHYRDVDLNTLSDLYGYNAKYISRMFKKLMNCSFKDYIFTMKCDFFCNTLIHSDLSIQEIMEEENISSESYFFNRFKQKYGMSPAEYRIVHQKEQ